MDLQRSVVVKKEFPEDVFKVVKEDGEYIFEHEKSGIMGLEVAERKKFGRTKVGKSEALRYLKLHTSCIKVLEVI